MTAKTNPLRTRLVELGISAEELAKLISHDLGTVVSWVEGEAEPTAEECVLLRFLKSDTDALRRVAALRRTWTITLEGERHDNVFVPYGTHDVGLVSG